VGKEGFHEKSCFIRGREVGTNVSGRVGALVNGSLEWNGCSIRQV